eukprot:gene9196-biopygen8243
MNDSPRSLCITWRLPGWFRRALFFVALEGGCKGNLQPGKGSRWPEATSLATFTVPPHLCIHLELGWGGGAAPPWTSAIRTCVWDGACETVRVGRCVWGGACGAVRVGRCVRDGACGELGRDEQPRSEQVQ